MFHIKCLLQYYFPKVCKQEIAMHLEGDITVENLTVTGHLSQLDINYVTSMTPTADPTSQKEQQMNVHYCDEVKFDAVTTKNLQDRLVAESVSTANSFPSSRAESDIDDGCNGNDDPLNTADNSAHSFSLPSTSQVDAGDNTDGIMVQYTKSTKNALLESALNNPTIDETESHW